MIPALRVKGSREGERPGKIFNFCLDWKIRSINFVVPKVKRSAFSKEGTADKCSLKL